GVTDRSHGVYAVNVGFNHFVFTHLVNTLTQSEAHNDVAEGNNVSDQGSRNRQQEHIPARETEVKYQVFRHQTAVWLGNAPLNIRQRVFTHAPTPDHGQNHARNHTEVGDFTGDSRLLQNVFKRHGEQNVGR